MLVNPLEREYKKRFTARVGPHIKIIPAETVTDVLKVALVRQPEPIEWDEEAEPAAPMAEEDAPGTGASLAH